MDLFLIQNKDVFAWFHENMLNIDLSFLVHYLNIDPKLRHVKPKRRSYNSKRYSVMNIEKNKLLKAG